MELFIYINCFWFQSTVALLRSAQPQFRIKIRISVSMIWYCALKVLPFQQLEAKLYA